MLSILPGVMFFEDGTGLIRNGTMVLRFDFTYTHDKQDEIEPSSIDLKFQNNETIILKWKK